MKLNVIKDFSAKVDGVETEFKAGTAYEFDESNVEALKEKGYVEEIKPEIMELIKSEVKETVKSVITVPAQPIVKEETGGFENVGEYIKAIAIKKITGETDSRLKAMGTADADGRYAIPEVWNTGIVNPIIGDGRSFVSRLNRKQMSGETLNIAIGEGRDAGLTMTLVTEGTTQLSSGTPVIKCVKLTKKTIAGLIYVTDSMLSDASFTSQWCVDSLKSAAQYALEKYAINGNGTTEPLGMLNAPSLVTVTHESSNNGAGTFIAANAYKMYSRELSSSSDYIWIMNPLVRSQLLNFNTSSTPNAFIPGGSLANAPYDRLLGSDIYYSDQCAALGTIGDVILVNPSKYILGYETDIKVAFSDHIKFDYLMGAIRVSMRVDGNVLVSAAITPAHGTGDLSSVIVCETR